VDLGIGGKRAAVAAATAGLGYACAEALVAEGVQVTICGSYPARA
jgi:3-oxoacyl-[acyl-carrier protein] reductase